MNRLTVARVLLGLTFVVFGFDGVLHFFPLPPMPEAAQAVIGTLISYRLFYVVKALEISCGALLLTNRHVTAALLVLAPIVFNIAWFDVNLDPKSVPVAVFLCVLLGAQLWGRRKLLEPLLAS